LLRTAVAGPCQLDPQEAARYSDAMRQTETPARLGMDAGRTSHGLPAPLDRRSFLAWLGAAGALAGCEASPRPAVARHVVLLGDSIFDNGRYVPGRPSVIEQLREAVAPAAATLLAHDGDVVADVEGQLERLPAAATHLVVSAGGNDALRHRGLLDRDVEHSAAVFAELARIRAEFAAAYRGMLQRLVARRLPTAVCTIYDSNFPPPQKALADVALTAFNDVILRGASEFGLPVLDLRRIFVAPADYANPIEPSDVGGARMVQAMLRLLADHDFAAGRCTLWS
jgi:hypothetical protein